MVFHSKISFEPQGHKGYKEKFLIITSVFSVSLWFIAIISHLAYAESIHIPALFLSLPEEGNPSITWFKKGTILYKIKAYEEAALAFSQIGKDAPQDIIEESLYLRSNSLMKTGDYSKAMAALNLIPVKSTFYSYALYTKAMISLNDGQEKEAIEYLEQISKKFPAENLALKAHLTLGFIYLESNQSAEAIKHFSMIPSDSPFYMQSLFGSGWAYASMGRWVRTVVFWEELSSLYPDSKYTREVMPYMGHAYTTLSAYGKALEQNGVALRYYNDSRRKLSDIETEIKVKDMKGIARAIDMIGDKKLTNDWELYHGLLSMEESLGKRETGKENNVEALINASKKRRSKIIEDISESLIQRIEKLKQQLSESSINTTLEIARNLRLEGGGHISNDMIFNEP